MVKIKHTQELKSNSQLQNLCQRAPGISFSENNVLNTDTLKILLNYKFHVIDIIKCAKSKKSVNKNQFSSSTYSILTETFQG